MLNTLNKSELRRTIRKARQSLDRDTRQRAEIAINRQLKSLIKRGKRIAVYYPIGSELRLDDFVRTARKRGANVYLPYIEPRHLRLWFTPYPEQVQAERPRHHRLAIPQFNGRKIRAHALHTMLLPIVAIDEMGYRLGQGGGFYDATLSATRHRWQPHTVAVGFACQKVAHIPHEAHDWRVDAFVCEHGRWQFGKNNKI